MTKTITISPTAAIALDRSIAKWKQCVKDARDGDASGTNAVSCALCQMFNKRLYEGNPRFRGPHEMAYAPVGKAKCGGCPIYGDTGRLFCMGTPYTEYERLSFDLDNDVVASGKALIVAARAELKYLQDLKKRCVVKEPK